MSNELSPSTRLRKSVNIPVKDHSSQNSRNSVGNQEQTSSLNIPYHHNIRSSLGQELADSFSQFNSQSNLPQIKQPSNEESKNSQDVNQDGEKKINYQDDENNENHDDDEHNDNDDEDEDEDEDYEFKTRFASSRSSVHRGSILSFAAKPPSPHQRFASTSQHEYKKSSASILQGNSSLKSSIRSSDSLYTSGVYNSEKISTSKHGIGVVKKASVTSKLASSFMPNNNSTIQTKTTGTTKEDDSEYQNKISSPSIAKSSRSGISDMTDDGVMTTIIQNLKDLLEYFYSTAIYNAFLWAYESTRFQIYLFTLIHVAILATMALILRFAIGSLVSGILFYNLVHAVAGLLGKISFAVGLRAAQLISKEFTARNMIKRGKGVPLSSIAHPIPLIKLNSDEGKTLRYIFIAALVLIEATVWFLGIQMEWEPAESAIGIFPCTKVTYPTKPDISLFASELGNFLQGDSDLSMVYSYGLPLGDGIVGGLAAWPITIPSASFIVDQAGIGYAINVVCGNLQVAENTTIGLTQFKILSTTMWSSMFSTLIRVQLPAGSHDWAQFSSSAITQDCEVRYIMGDADVSFGFIADEWGGVASQRIEEMRLGNLTIQRGETSALYYGLMQDEFRINYEYKNITEWVAEAVVAVFNGTHYGTSQGALFCNLFQWATLPDGYYHTSITWKGMAAAMAMVAHYVLMQYSTSGDGAQSQCAYKGLQGAGVIACPTYVVGLAAGAVVVCVVAEVAQLFWWFLLSGGDSKNDRAARLLDAPAQLLYDLRLGATNILTASDVIRKDNDPSDADVDASNHANLRRRYASVLVRFGETRQTRANPVGMLVLGAPNQVISMNESREYY
ncbi:hypothetical protein HK100_004464 [Physocladia obscura]|uniref:Uncharacterized protein n=1 Tax=Physocladia obscura TaxID=109957 RepID=A0AAD5TFN3_9FUNG|nr:hypothetical protein HK100_004464 [Physocladia obscura]